jgi:hypothetical protein
VANDAAAYSAGLAQGRADVANRVSSMAPPEYESSQDYADGYAAGFAQADDPASYADGEAQGRSDTVHKVSSAPPAYADPQTHYDHPGTPADSYNKGYEAGASAQPYTSDLEAQEKAEREAREQSQRNMMPPFPTIDPNFQPGPVGPPQTSMSPISEADEEAAKKYTEEKEANERYFELHKDWEDELKRTTPEDVTGQPLAD